MNKLLLATLGVALVAAPSAIPSEDQVAGYVSITPERIWLLFVDSTRKPPAAPSLTDAEAVAMMKSHVAWTGGYSIGAQTPEGIKFTAHVDAASSQAITGTDRVYFMRVEGKRLTMKSPGPQRTQGVLHSRHRVVRGLNVAAKYLIVADDRAGDRSARSRWTQIKRVLNDESPCPCISIDTRVGASTQHARLRVDDDATI